MVALAVTDSHALIWAATGRLRKLGRQARKLFERAELGQAAIFVPTIALVEIGEAAQEGAISLSGGFSGWVEALLSTGNYHAVDLTLEIVLRAASLHGIAERGDRLIAATALELGYPLMTRDPGICRIAAVDCLW